MPSVDRHLDGRDIRVVLLYVGVVRGSVSGVPSVHRGPDAGTVSLLRRRPHLGCRRAGDLHGLDAASAPGRSWPYQKELAASRWSWTHLGCNQFFLTLYGYRLPAPVDWVPLLTMSLMVGLFEAIFFRGFIQTRLSASFGPVPGVIAARHSTLFTTSATAWEREKWRSCSGSAWYTASPTRA